MKVIRFITILLITLSVSYGCASQQEKDAITVNTSEEITELNIEYNVVIKLAINTPMEGKRLKFLFRYRYQNPFF
jgi:hypothetical protein